MANGIINTSSSDIVKKLGTAAYQNVLEGSKGTDSWGTVPLISGSDGVMEVGKILDFHVTDGNTKDYDARILASTTGFTLTGTTSGTFSGSLTGNASTATKFATARTIALSGDVTGSTSFDGSGNATASVTRRGAFVGQNSSTPTNVYYKVASVSISEHYGDRNITFYVHKSWSSVHPATHSGILTINLRTDGSGYSESCACHWLVAGSGIDVSKFILAHNTSTSPAVAELWCKVDEAYSGWAFDVIGENTRLARSNSLWTLYNTFTAGSQSAITSGYTQVVSSLVTLKNSISGNTSTATTATTATKDSKGQTITSTYIKGLSVSGQTITYTKGDGTTGTIKTQDTNTTYSVMSGATATKAGSSGLVPAPAAGKQSSFLRGDGTWVSVSSSGGGGINNPYINTSKLKLSVNLIGTDSLSVFQKTAWGLSSRSYTWESKYSNAMLEIDGKTYFVQFSKSGSVTLPTGHGYIQVYATASGGSCQTEATGVHTLNLSNVFSSISTVSPLNIDPDYLSQSLSISATTTSDNYTKLTATGRVLIDIIEYDCGRDYTRANATQYYYRVTEYRPFKQMSVFNS